MNCRNLIAESFFFFLFTLFLLAVGSSFLQSDPAWMTLSILWAASVFIFFPKETLAGIRLPRLSILLFLTFLIFIAIRTGLVFFHLISIPAKVPSQFFIQSLFLWGLYFLGFVTSLVFFNRKSTLMHWFILSATIAFLISFNMIPPLAKTIGAPFYQAGSQRVIFYPALYFHPWIQSYILPLYSHPNRIGDVLAIGFFPALGLLFYTFLQFKDRIKTALLREEKPNFQEWRFFAIYGTCALVIGATILLLYSRGTILCMTLVFLASFFLLAMKFPSKTQWGFLIAFLTVGFVFFSWAGNLEKAWKEVRTLKDEQAVVNRNITLEVYKSRSMYVNQEAARRALRIQKDFPVWGIGTGGYYKIARNYSSGGDYDALDLASATAMCHYLQTLAEEGIGAFIYYAFLLCYFGELLWGLFLTKSQFKFIAALSLSAPVLVILSHAAIIDTMQRFSIAMPVYILMGASLAALRKDFQHEG